MSLFNNLFGFEDGAALLLSLIELDYVRIPRFRDVYFDKEQELICVHTRTG